MVASIRQILCSRAAVGALVLRVKDVDLARSTAFLHKKALVVLLNQGRELLLPQIERVKPITIEKFIGHL
jgi:hypothetical protein